jgi:hypothetical protein
MTTRVFLILGILLSLSALANESARLNLMGRIYPQIQVTIAPKLTSSEAVDNYSVRSNMSGETYKVFFENKGRTYSKGKFRHLVIEAK